ncbi:S8 family serine peptidase [Roseomonas eburnea]|uniref:S8 family serine peptidase n=1 Tax=Neoroseomonas eburnea TaxID=1346889 RepID=A0A9X9XDD0_9PROT|nr:S8 family serine peptidase [Neoroseomonas eburnea]MBR0681716.1 S8 family serine peptidase [Neoroseomonas eburnea]
MNPKPRRGEAVGPWGRADLRTLRATLLAILLAAEATERGPGIEAVRSAGPRSECDLLLDFDGHPADLAGLRSADGARPVQFVAQVGSLFAVRIDAEYLRGQLDLLDRWNDDGPPPPEMADGDSLAGLVAAGAIRRASLGRAARVASGQAGQPTGGRRAVRDVARAEVTAEGAGVTIGIIDTVFDYAHVAMLPPGHTLEAPPPPNEALRVVSLFDPYARRAAGGFGVRHTRSELAQDIADCLAAGDDRPLRLAQRDAAAGGDTEATRRQLFANHGTFCAGIAAGSGNASIGGRYRGIAPAARIACAIAGIQDNAALADSLDVVTAVVRMVEESDTPLALLLNNGDCLGAHDGTLLGELMLDELLLHPGRAIVLPAGNQNVGNTETVGAGKTRIVPHLAIPGSMTEPRLERLAFSYTTRASKADTIEIWFRAQDTPTATVRVEPAQPPIEPLRGDEGRPIRVLSLIDGDARATVIAELGRAMERGLWRLHILLLPIRGAMPIDTLRFEIAGVVGELHAWCDWNNATQRDWSEPPAGREDDVTTLTTPATAHRVIVVGECEDDATGFHAAEASGRGPTRDGRFKPDLVAIGASVAVPVPQRSPEAHRNLAAAFAARPELLERHAYGATIAGTSFTAPQVVGLAALLFEKWPDATWADIRQAIVEGAVRPEHWIAGDAGEGDAAPTPLGAAASRALEALPPEPGIRAIGWDRALGYGRMDVARTLSPPPPRFDVWLRKSAGDDGREPCVGAVLWDAPGITPIGPHRLRVETLQRGREPIAGPARLYLFRAPFGAVHPLPRLEGARSARGAWEPLLTREDGSPAFVSVMPGEAVEVSTRADIDLSRSAGVIAAVLDHDDDRYEPAATLGMRNNVAVLATHEAKLNLDGTIDAPVFSIIGSEDVDSLLVWGENISGKLRLGGLPITALPWRAMRMFLECSRLRSWKRPYFGQQDDAAADPANQLARESDMHDRGNLADAIAGLTGVVGADGMELRRSEGDAYARLGFAAAGNRLWIPRLRLAQDQQLPFDVTYADARLRSDQPVGWVHAVHFSGGRRVGGGSLRITRTSD